MPATARKTETRSCHRPCGSRSDPIPGTILVPSAGSFTAIGEFIRHSLLSFPRPPAPCLHASSQTTRRDRRDADCDFRRPVSISTTRKYLVRPFRIFTKSQNPLTPPLSSGKNRPPFSVKGSHYEWVRDWPNDPTATGGHRQRGRAQVPNPARIRPGKMRRAPNPFQVLFSFMGRGFFVTPPRRCQRKTEWTSNVR
jgi:hypothetical protein